MFTAQSTPAPVPIPVASIDPNVMELDDNGQAWFAKLADARSAKAAAADREQIAQRNIKALLGERTTATIDGRQVVTYKEVASTRLDQAAAKELLGDQWEACQKRTTTRSFRVVD